MGISTVDSTENRLGLDSLPLVDLRFLSQSELNSLSLCRDDAFDLRLRDDIVVPTIDRSIFNESAGSRKQTYSRRRSGLLPLSAQPATESIPDSELRENQQIVLYLRNLFSGNPQTLTVATSSAAAAAANGRRDRRKERSNTAIVVYQNEYEVVNRIGDRVDVAGLAGREDPFGEELKRRTEGLETEEEFLGFLNGLEGQWGSRRKKRKIVVAGDFGDELPMGWKLLLGLKRREGRVSLICRRYISPNGQQFVSCKEVSSYLLPYIQPQESQPVPGHIDENTHGTCKMVTESTAGPTNQVGIDIEAPICYSATPVSSISTNFEKQIVLFRVENPVKAQLRNLLECRKCNLTFGDKDSYVQHLLSFHKRNAKRCRVGKSIADGVIVKDGKYECQFCHKIFDEKRRYNSHVGIHVRDYDKSLESLPDDIIVQTCIEPSTFVLMPSAITEMDALVEMGIAKDTVPVTSMAKSSNESDIGFSLTKHNKDDTEIGVTPQSGALETLASTSVDERDNGCEMIDDISRKAVETNNTMDYEINNCMDARTSVSSEATNVACDVYCGKDLSHGDILGENDKSGNEQKGIGSYSDILPAYEPTHGTDTCDASHDKDLSPSSMLDENDKSGNEQNSTESYSDILSNNEPPHADSCDASHDKDLTPSSMLDENDKSGNEPENGTESYSDILPDNDLTHGTDTCVNETGKSSNEMDSAFESCSITLPDNEETCGFETSVDEILNSNMNEAMLDEMEKFANGLESDLGSSHPKSDIGMDMEIIGSTGEENVLQNVVSDTSSLLLQSSGLFPSIDMISDKGEEFSDVSQKLENISDFNDLGLDEIETPNFCFATGQDSSTLPETPMDLSYGAELEQGLVRSVSFEWDTISELSPKMGSSHHLTAVCVWCRREFNHEGLNLEMQLDSVGFMCPTCKSKISGQLNVLDNGLPMNSNQL